MQVLSHFNATANLSFKKTSSISSAVPPYNLYWSSVLEISPPLFAFPTVTTVPSYLRAINTLLFAVTVFTPDVSWEAFDEMFVSKFGPSPRSPQTVKAPLSSKAANDLSKANISVIPLKSVR